MKILHQIFFQETKNVLLAGAREPGEPRRPRHLPPTFQMTRRLPFSLRQSPLLFCDKRCSRSKHFQKLTFLWPGNTLTLKNNLNSTPLIAVLNIPCNKSTFKRSLRTLLWKILKTISLVLAL